MASDEISARIVLEGGKEAVKDLQAVAKEAKKLDGTEIEVPIGADTKKAERDIAGLMSKVDKLDSDAATILLTSNATSIANEIGDLIIDIDKLDASDPTIDIKATQINALKGDLDQVEAKIRQVNNVPVEVNTRSARAGFGDVIDGADGANSAISNMVGNATQDLGQLGGITGSAGVAVGQLAEYFSDAGFKAKAAGQGFGAIVKTFAAATGPIALLSAGVAIATKAWQDYQKRQQEVAANTKAAATELANITGVVDDLNKVLEDQAKLGDFGDQLVASLAKSKDGFPEVTAAATQLNIPLTELGDIIAGFGRKGTAAGFEKLVQSMQGSLGVSRQQAEGLAKALDQSKGDQESLVELAVAYTDLNGDQVRALGDQLKLYLQIRKAATDTDINKVAKDQLQLIQSTVEGLTLVNEARRRLADQGIVDPTDIQLLDETTRGVQAVGEATDAATFLAAGFKNAWGGALTFVKDAWKKGGEEAEKLRKKAEETSSALDGITADWKEMSDEVSEKSFGEAIDQLNGLSELDLAQVRQDTVGAFDDVKGAIKDAAKEVKNWGKMDLTPDSFEELKGMPDSFGKITDAVSGMRTSIQTELKAAFDTGGVKGFVDKFDFFAGQVREQFTTMFRGMGLPEDQVQAQVQRILGDLSLLPKDKTILIKLTRDQESKNALDLFKADIEAIEQANPQIDIRTKLQAGDIQGALDELNALRISEGKDPIVLQTDIDRLGAARATAETRERAATYLRNNPAQLGINVNEQDTVNQAMAARNAAQALLYRNKVYLPIAILPLPGRDAGGTVPSGGGIVAEKRPEIVNGRYLVTSPTVVPAGTRVTSGARTARILRTRGHRGLKQYDAGGTVVAGAQTFNVNVNASMVGNRFELARAVDKGVRDIRRLRGTRG